MEEILGSELWEAIQVYNPILAAAIVAVAGVIKSKWKDSPRWSTIVAGLILTAIYYFVADGVRIVGLIGPFLASIFGYDMIVQPIKKSTKEKETPIGGGGGGPIIDK